MILPGKPDAVALYFRGVMLEVIRERFRQEDLKVEGKFRWTCADVRDPNGVVICNPDRLTVLAEEFGEVSHVVCDEMTHGSLPDDEDKLRTELIQVAAVAVAWVEAIDKRKEEERE
jgi:hypothetical protein